MWWKRKTANELLAIISRLEQENENLRLEINLLHQSIIERDGMNEDQARLIKSLEVKCEEQAATIDKAFAEHERFIAMLDEALQDGRPVRMQAFID